MEIVDKTVNLYHSTRIVRAILKTNKREKKQTNRTKNANKKRQKRTNKQTKKNKTKNKGKQIKTINTNKPILFVCLSVYLPEGVCPH